MRKLTAEDLDKIAGGTLEGAYALGLEMLKKYGIADEDWNALSDVISDEDFALLWDEFLKKE